MLEPLLSPATIACSPVLSPTVERVMKLCQTCHSLSADEDSYCPHDGQLLVTDALATALQQSLGAKYTLTKLIGTGSMGAVYRAQHQSLDVVAIKVMLGPPDNHKLSERFLREARALRKLRHQHSVLVYDLERSPTGLTYMVMEMVEGRSLRDELRARGQLTLEEAMTIVEAVCAALQAAHERGIIHRDLKPDNILLADEKTADGTLAQIIKIADFGIVKLRGTQQGSEEASMQLTKHGTPIGTPFYMSPEQWFGDGPGFTALDGRTDIYSLGCTLYEMLAGRPPFLGQTTDELRHKHLNDLPQPLDELAPTVPQAFSRATLRALEKDKDLRPASAEEFASELRRAYDENRTDANKATRESSRAQQESAKDDARISVEQLAKLQATEESVQLVRNWAIEEAQQAIEQVRHRRVPPVPPAMATPVASQSNNEAPVEQMPLPSPAVVEDFEKTLTSGIPRIEFEPDEQDTADSSVNAELRQTLLFERKQTPPTPALEAAETAQESKRDRCELMVAQAGAWRIGLLADEADGVLTGRTPVPLPHAPAAVLGVVNMRGRMLTVIDPLALLNQEHASETNAPPSFIIALRGDEQLALAVAHIEGAIGIYMDEIEPPAQGSDTTVIRGLIRSGNGQIIMLDTRELFDAATHEAERRRQRTS
jgi:serine/threonine protein kinase/chemotaxis signal transduction protein